MNRRRAALIVLDGLGIGAAPDAADWGDVGSDTLGNVARAAGGLSLPNLERMGLGLCAPLEGIRRVESPEAAHGVAVPDSPGKDSTTGHWELCGLKLARAFPTYPGGFPEDVVSEFARRTARPVMGNIASSGTTILDQLGAEHVRTGAWIVYTSADSVFQVAAHEEVVPVEELYRACGLAREMLTGEHGVSRVIARPFIGTQGAWTRTPRRKDFSLAPPGETLVDRLAAQGIPRVGVGKVDDLFAGRNLSSRHTATNAEAYELIADALGTMEQGLLFANVIEFDQSWGHRNDVAGFVRGLLELDAAMPWMLEGLRHDDLVIFTADHGNDPTTPSTDHSREQVPVLVTGPRVRPQALGTRQTFADVGQTMAEFLGVEPLGSGTSFMREVWID